MNKLFSLIILSTIWLMACNSEHKNEVHDHGIEPLVYTVYSDKLELFVEFKPLVVGSVTKFASHLTVLGEKFSALDKAEVSVSLIVDGAGIKQSVDSASSPGIFRLELKPTKSGSAKLIFDIKTKEYTDQFVIENLVVYADETAAKAASTGTSNAGDISFLKEQAWGIDFSTKLVTESEFHDVIKTSGQILSAVGEEIIVSSGGNGIIRFAGSNIVEGAEVKIDEKLFLLSGGQLAEKNVEINYKEVKANYDKAKSDFERMSELVKDKIVSEKDYLQSKNDWEKAEARYLTLAKNYSTAGQAILSPFHGYIQKILVKEGEFVEAGTPLASITKNQKLLLQANVSQKYFEKLKDVSSANFKVVNRQEVFSIQDLKGKLLSYGRSAAENNPFVPITFEFINSPNIISGSLAEVFLQSAVITDAFVIPVSALIEEQGFFYVYVQKGGESFEKRLVKTGAGDGIHVQIISGLDEGERVVDKGAYQIKLSAASGAMPAHGHEH